MRGQPVYKPPSHQYIFVGRLKIGHGLVLPDVGLSPTWRARDQGERSTRILNLSNKNTEKRSFSVYFHLNRFIWASRIVAIAVGCKPTALRLRWFESNLAHQGECGNYFLFINKNSCSPGDGIRNLVVAYKRVIMYAV